MRQVGNVYKIGKGEGTRQYIRTTDGRWFAFTGGAELNEATTYCLERELETISQEQEREKEN